MFLCSICFHRKLLCLINLQALLLSLVQNRCGRKFSFRHTPICFKIIFLNGLQYSKGKLFYVLQKSVLGVFPWVSHQCFVLWCNRNMLHTPPLDQVSMVPLQVPASDWLHCVIKLSGKTCTDVGWWRQAVLACWVLQEEQQTGKKRQLLLNKILPHQGKLK